MMAAMAAEGVPMRSGDDPQLEIVVQRWPDVSEGEARSLIRLMRRADGVGMNRIVSHSGRPTGAAALVDTSRGLLFIKRYARSVRDVDTIVPYHRFAAYVADRGISTPRFEMFVSSDGDAPVSDDALSSGLSSPGSGDSWRAAVDGSVLVHGPMAYEAYWVADGEDLYGDALTWDPPRTIGHARSLGGFLARIDVASRGFDDPPLTPNGMSNRFGVFASEDIDAAVDSWLDGRPSVRRYLELTGRELHADLDVVRPYARALSRSYGTLETQWTHGDPHVSNFLWTNGRPSAVIDFGLADRNTALFDLAMLIERHCIQWVDVMNGNEDAYRLDVAEALLDGYAEVRPLSDVERMILPDVLAISQAQAGLAWLQYYMDGTHRMDDAAWCYDVCLMAHTRWFGSPSGRRFLDGLRALLGSSGSGGTP